MSRTNGKVNPYGCNPEFTPQKWFRHESMVKINLFMWKGCTWRRGDYHYFDFYAGPGLITEMDSPELAGQKGSPFRAIDMIRAFCPDLAARVFLFDEDEEISRRLRANLARDYGDSAEVACLDCADAVHWLITELRLRRPAMPERHGLAFFDPNGVPDWKAIKDFRGAKPFENIDLFININSTVSKRLRLSTSPRHARPEFKLKPTEHLACLRKKRISLWEPCPGDNHRFALAYCTDGPAPTWRESGFYPIESREGQRIARRMDLSQEERIALGGTTGTLFDMKGGAYDD